MKALLLVSLLFISLSASSQDWIKVAEDDKNSAIYIDKSSIRREGNLISSLVNIEYNDDEYKSEYVNEYLNLLKEHEYPNGIPQSIMMKWMKFKFTIYYMVYDTANNQSRTSEIINYDQNGVVLSRSELGDASKLQNIEQDSLDAIILEELVYYTSNSHN